MKKLSLFLCITMIIYCNISTISISAANVSTDPTDVAYDMKMEDSDILTDQSIVMPDLGIDIVEVSSDTADEIEELLEEMNSLAIQSNEMAEPSALRTETAIQNQLYSIEQEYNSLEAQAEELGCHFLTDEQAAQYVYGGSLPAASTNASISYPAISGINFAITYYTFKGVSMAKCVATQKPNTESKLVKNYDTVEMFSETKISDLYDKGIQMTATKLTSYLLSSSTSGTIKYAVNAIVKLPGTVYPSSSSSSKAKLSLTVSTNSTVVHIWRLVGSQYYFRTASVKAKITETWILRDVNANHYTKTHSYYSYSNYYDDSQQALNINTNQSYGIYQQYKAQGLLGLYFQKQEVSPFTAALPVHFSS